MTVSVSVSVIVIVIVIATATVIVSGYREAKKRQKGRGGPLSAYRADE